MRDVLDGTRGVAGVDLTVLRLPIEEIFFRSTFHREFDVSEMSFAKIVALAAQDDRGFVPLPVFPSRAFRHSSIYVRTDSRHRPPERPGGQARRRARMGADRRGLFARDCSRTTMASTSPRSTGIRRA